MNRQRLIIRISRDGIALSTSDEGTVRYERYPMNSGISLAANMREALRTQLLLQDDYEKVLVLTDSPVLTIPVNTFREEERDQLYHYTFTRHCDACNSSRFERRGRLCCTKGLTSGAGRPFRTRQLSAAHDVGMAPHVPEEFYWPPRQALCLFP